MKNAPYLLFLLLSTALLTACDPWQRINMINHSASEAIIEWKIKEDSVLKSYFFISNATKLKFELKTNAPYNKVSLSAAQGKWTEAALNQLANDLESLTIIHAGDTVILTNKNEITDFLLKRRTGIGKTRVDIVFN